MLALACTRVALAWPPRQGHQVLSNLRPAVPGRRSGRGHKKRLPARSARGDASGSSGSSSSSSSSGSEEEVLFLRQHVKDLRQQQRPAADTSRAAAAEAVNSAARPITPRPAPLRPAPPRAAQALTASQHPGPQTEARIDRTPAAAAGKPLEFDNELGQRAAEQVGFGLYVNGFTAAFKRFCGGGSSGSGSVEEVLFLRQQLQAKDLQIKDLAALLKTALDIAQQKGEDNPRLRDSKQQQQQRQQQPPAAGNARAAAAEAAAAAAVAFASKAASHEAAAEAAQAAAANQPAAQGLGQAGKEWLQASATWLQAFEALEAARQALPGSDVVRGAEEEVRAARRFKQQRRTLRG